MKYMIAIFSMIFSYIVSVGIVAGEEHMTKSPLGDITTARKRFPEFFAPGVVTLAEISSTSSYLICATSSRDFSDEKDSELLTNLQLTAKNALLEYLTNGKPAGMMLEISGMQILYSWGDNDSHSANFVVPVTGVKLHRKPHQQTETQTDQRDGCSKQTEIAEKYSKDPLNPPQGGDGVAKKIFNEAEISALVDHFTTLKLTELVNALQSLVAEKNSSLPDALILYEKLNRNSEDVDTLQTLGKLYESNGSKSYALVHYNLASKILESKSLEQAESLNYKIAVLTEETKDAREALDCFNNFFKRYPVSKHTPEVLKKIAKLRSSAPIRINHPIQ
jgi:tetratricopeptide (TPR) repeat protein